MSRRQCQRWMVSLWLLGMVLCLPVLSQAQCQGVTVPVISFDYESITVGATAIGFTAAKIVQAAGTAVMAFVSVETASISMTLNGTTPTSSIGHLWTAGQAFTVCGSLDIGRFRAIQVVSSGTMKVTYFKSAR